MTVAAPPQRTTGDLELAMADLLSARGVLDGLRHMPWLVASAEASAPDHAVGLLAPVALDHRSDPLPAYIAMRALAAVGTQRAALTLTKVLSSDDPGAMEHAAWALSSCRPFLPAVTSLVDMSQRGGFGQMMAELALENWVREIPELAWRPEANERLTDLADHGDAVQSRANPKPGLRIAQVLMQGRVDSDLGSPGHGDGGGLVTLQVGLTRELAVHPSVSDVVLVTRLIEGESPLLGRRHEAMGRNASIARLRFGPSGYVPIGDMWAHRADLEKELRRFLLSRGPFDALHLRFADVGTFVAARLAQESGIPIFFTLAPDPHALIAGQEQSGSLRRENFGRADRDQHLVFRAWLVEWMLDHAKRLALLPRVDQVRKFHELVGIDIECDPDRFVVIPEGVDSDRAAEARRSLRQSSDELPGVLRDLSRAVDDLAPERQGLPLLLSVGRLSQVKGMDRVVAAWANDQFLAARFNLVVVGGNLENPSRDEEIALRAVDNVLSGRNPEDLGLVFLGGRSNRDVSFVMAAAAHGMGQSVAPNGIYACGSEKEEFGLAIMEALAAGLPVVAPQVGGPGTYIDHESTGYLADTTSVEAIVAGLRWADRVRESDVRSASAINMVRSTYSLSAMAEDLVTMYTTSSEEHSAS